MNRWPLITLGLLLIFFSLACQSVPFLAHPTPTPTVTPTPTKTPTPTGIAGITLPVSVDGVQIKFTSVSKVSLYKMGNTEYKPKTSEDIFLVADAEVLSAGVSYKKVFGWAVTVNDAIKWSLNQTRGGSDSVDSVVWVFVVDKSESSFEIHFPGGVDILLDSLLR
jgi:hypothetical protein